MDRSDTPTLLIPLLALLAIAFPFAVNLRSPTPSVRNIPQPSQATEQQSNKGSEEAGTVPQPHSAAKLIEDFLHAPSDRKIWPPDDPRRKYSLDFMIAIVADPIDSRLTRIFDSTMDSIQRAFEADGYELDRFDLAWSEPVSTKTDDKTSKTVAAGSESPRYQREPSLLLFRKPNEYKLFMVFLVGETPTSGLHKAAMSSALLQLANFFWWGPGPNRPSKDLRNLAQEKPKRALTIKIMGPTFSGTAPSLKFALRDWLDKIQTKLSRPRSLHLKFRIVSGSATAIDPKEFSNIGAGDPQTFQAVVPPDEIAMPVIRAYVRSLGYGISYKRIAMLSEAGTAYGQANLRRDQREQKDLTNEYKQGSPPASDTEREIEDANKRKTNKEPEVINLPFPLHISQLRTESERQRESQQKSTSEVINNPAQTIPLKAGESSQPKETPPSFSSLGAPSSELVLSGLLSTISHEGIHAVGILATDMRDIIFLAREIHQHCPGTLVFTVSSDLLYSHPDVGGAARGMLVFTPYPLYNLNQVWASPFLGQATRVQFPSQDAEGVYNATLALLCRKDLILDYGQPFPSQRTKQGSKCTKPALWVTVVGRDGPLPVGTLRWIDRKNYSVQVKPEDLLTNNDLPKPPTLDKQGIYRAGSALAVVLLSVILFAFSLFVIREYHSRASVKQGGGSGWASGFFGEPATAEYRRQASLFMLAGLACLLSFYLVVISAFTLPAIASWRLGTAPASDWRWSVPFVLVAISIAAALLSLLSAVTEVGYAFLISRGQKRVLRGVVQVTILVGCAFVLFILAPRLTGIWLSAAWTGSANAFFVYTRAFQFLSGLSPLVPLLCIALAGFLWAFCAFQRLRMIDGIRPTGGVSNGEESLLSLETDSIGGLRALEKTVWERLERASAFSTALYWTLIVIGLFTAGYLFFCPFVPSYEGPRFYFLYGWGFFLVYSALTSEFGRLCLAWHDFRHLLQRLALLPMQKAYGRYRESFKELPRVDLAIRLQPVSVLSFSVDQAERLLRLGSSLVSSPTVSGNVRTNLKLWNFEAQRAVPTATRNLSRALKADANGKWRLAVVARSRAQRALGKLAQATTVYLEPSWRTAPKASAPPRAGSALQEFMDLGEEFLVGRVVLLISYVLPSLRRLGTFILTGLLLMLFSVMVYPFVQKNHFLAFNWIVILAFVGLALLVMLQMERDAVLSALNGTTPGQIKVTRQFAFRILTYVMVPVLVLLSAQFPDTLGQIISWFSAAQGH